MYSLVDEHRLSYGVESICRVLQIAPSGYWRHMQHRTEPFRRSARARRDERLMSDIERIWQANHSVYGARKVWHQMLREGLPVARCTIERLMRQAGLRGVMRGQAVRTTISDPRAACPLDRVNRQFRADRPNQLWVTDSGVVALCADNNAVEVVDRGSFHAAQPKPFLPLHEHCLFKLGVYLGELWFLGELAQALEAAGRSAFLLTAPPLRLPGAFGSPVTPIATI